MTDWDKRVQIVPIDEYMPELRAQIECHLKNSDIETAPRLIMISVRQEIQALQTQADALESALEDAFESIHSEYCGRTHHPVCDLPRNTLASYRKFKGGGE